jgi:hypothetical protein
MTINAHFDGKVIITDERLDLPPNAALLVQIERVGAKPNRPRIGIELARDQCCRYRGSARVLADRHDHYPYGRPSTNGRA